MTRKKYNPLKYKQFLANSLVKNICLVWCNGNQTVQAYNYKTLKKHSVDLRFVEILDNTRFNWLTACAVFMREKNGKEKIKVAYAGAGFETYHHQINDSLNEQHQAFIKSIGYKDLICGLGWVAVPADVELSIETIEALLKSEGAFDYLAPWESEK